MTATSTARNPHGLGSFDPADYTTTGLLMPSDSEEGQACWRAMSSAEKQEIIAIAEAYEEAHGPASFNRCAHCGNWLRWVHVVQHVPTGEFLPWGSVCIERLSIPTREGFVEMMSEIGRKAWAERGRRIARVEKFVEAEPIVALFIGFGVMSGDRFYRALYDSIRLYDHPFTTNMRAALNKAMTDAVLGVGRFAPKIEKVEPAHPLPVGKLELVGRIVSTKYQEGYMGDVFKMLVELDDGNRVWGTVPSKVQDHVMNYNNDVAMGRVEATSFREYEGLRVSFSATVERSDRDEHFGFFKRPSKVRVIG